MFPNLKTSIRTTKGSALFFFNYNRRNSRETKMQHYSCPVILGIKEGKKVGCWDKDFINF